MSDHTFVGLVGADRPEALLQHHTKLYMVNYVHLGEELFYQLGLRQFGRLGKITLQPAPAIEELLRLAVSNEAEARAGLPLSENDIVLVSHACSSWRTCVPDIGDAQKLASALRGKREMLSEYFSLDITENGTLYALPLLLPQFQPSLDQLPLCTHLFCSIFCSVFQLIDSGLPCQFFCEQLLRYMLDSRVPTELTAYSG